MCPLFWSKYKRGFQMYDIFSNELVRLQGITADISTLEQFIETKTLSKIVVYSPFGK